MNELNEHELSLSDIVPDGEDGELRLSDLRLGERLGFERPRVIRELISRNETELRSYGALATRYGKSRGQPFKEYRLNEAQALLICMFARTDKAAQVRKEVTAVYLALRGANIKSQPQLTDEQCAKAEDAMSAKIYASLSDEITARINGAWAQVHHCFGVEHHREIYQTHFDALLKHIEILELQLAFPIPPDDGLGPQHLTPDQLFARWGGKIRKTTLANWRSRKVGPRYAKFGRAVMYRLSDVVEWERSQRVPTQMEVR